MFSSGPSSSEEQLKLHLILGEGVVRNEENKNLNPTGPRGNYQRPNHQAFGRTGAAAEPDLRKTGTRTPWRIQGYPRTSASEFAHRHLYDQLSTGSVLPSGCARQWLAASLLRPNPFPQPLFWNCKLPALDLWQPADSVRLASVEASRLEFKGPRVGRELGSHPNLRHALLPSPRPLPSFA